MSNPEDNIVALTEQLERQQAEIDRLRDRPAPLRRFIRRCNRFPFPKAPWWVRLRDRYRDVVPQSAFQIIKRSPLFDAAWYLAEYPELSDSRLAIRHPEKHYYLHGAAQGLNPGPHFNTRAYIANYPDVRTAGVNPLVHYELFGRDEGRVVSL